MLNHGPPELIVVVGETYSNGDLKTVKTTFSKLMSIFSNAVSDFPRCFNLLAKRLKFGADFKSGVLTSESGFRILDDGYLRLFPFFYSVVRILDVFSFFGGILSSE